MSRNLALFPVFAALIALSSCAAPATYELTAAEGVGIDSIPGEIIIKDARIRLPQLLKECGISLFKNVPATDYVVIFRFIAPVDGAAIHCIRTALPPGADLRRA